MTRVRDWIDQILPSLVILGRGTNTIALKTGATELLEIRNEGDSAYRDLRLRNTHLDGFLLTSRSFPGRRQATLVGSVDSNGQPNALTTPGGLSVTLNASSTTPYIVSFAEGFDNTGGALDYVGAFTSNQAIAVLANTTNYIYIQRNSLGVLSANFASQAPIYSRVAPSSPATGQHWFNTSPSGNTSAGQRGMTMYSWSGSVWVANQRVFIGEAVTNASVVTSLINYAYQRRYQSAWTAATAANNINFNHNLGMTLAEAEASVSFFGRQNSSSPQLLCPSYYLSNTGDQFGLFCNIAVDNPRLNQNNYVGANGFFFNGSAWITSGDLMMCVNSGW